MNSQKSRSSNPYALENLHRQPRTPGQGHRIDGQLSHGMLVFSRIGLVVEHVEEGCAQLEEVNVAGSGFAPNAKVKAWAWKQAKSSGVS
jgi:hypothetical protein